jgi:hypothetical protein
MRDRPCKLLRNSVTTTDSSEIPSKITSLSCFWFFRTGSCLGWSLNSQILGMHYYA